MLVDAIGTKKAKYLPNNAAVAAYLKSKELSDTVIFTMGAGDIYLWGKSITDTIHSKYE
jgi:UDP-N-acetylmuramate-alanine ligase